ncbi:hypothetical protein C2845_PM05G28790 [Panicum miliaceum]|uniref:Uncharacterized protein n=1 Tax=Panicum miliaceum TaxID=4540 RepID=A0A3L6T1P9_PANMI|nr:hypothetical protein C2845_PM05G28790 [Panicum miliaceum]
MSLRISLPAATIPYLLAFSIHIAHKIYPSPISFFFGGDEHSRHLLFFLFFEKHSRHLLFGGLSKIWARLAILSLRSTAHFEWRKKNYTFSGPLACSDFPGPVHLGASSPGEAESNGSHPNTGKPSCLPPRPNAGDRLRRAAVPVRAVPSAPLGVLTSRIRQWARPLHEAEATEESSGGAVRAAAR